MITTYTLDPYKKYDRYNTPTDILRWQVCYLYDDLRMPISTIHEITGYSIGTIKNYACIYRFLLDKFKPYDTYEYFTRDFVEDFHDNYERPEAPNDCGLYLVGSTHFDPITDEKYYWIKVGMSTELDKRIKSYKTENPMVWTQAYEIFDREDVKKRESYCQDVLATVAKAKAEYTKEWFLVSRETYFEICGRGFEYFFN